MKRLDGLRLGLQLAPPGGPFRGEAAQDHGQARSMAVRAIACGFTELRGHQLPWSLSFFWLLGMFQPPPPLRGKAPCSDADADAEGEGIAAAVEGEDSLSGVGGELEEPGLTAPSFPAAGEGDKPQSALSVAFCLHPPQPAGPPAGLRLGLPSHQAAAPLGGQDGGE